MPTVRPQPRYSVFRKFTRQRLTQRACRKVSVISIDDVIDDVTKLSSKDTDDAGFCGESFADSGELLASLSPLLFSMKLFGMYFERGDRHRRNTDDPERDPASPETRQSSSWLRVYSTAILILVWLNVCRFLTVFDKNDQFGAVLLRKMMIFAWFCLFAIMYTAYYFASNSGKLARVILTLPVTADCARSTRRAVAGLTTLVWMSVITHVAHNDHSCLIK